MKVANTKIYGLENAIRCSKFPMTTDLDELNSDVTPTVLALGSCERGTGHDNFLKGIIVQFDLTFSNKAWVEAERYHWLDFISSQSTMHRITKFKFKDQCNKYVDERIISIVQEIIDEYNSLDLQSRSSAEGKEMYLGILYSVPSGFELTAGMTTNFQQLKTVYGQRYNHRLPEWREFCKWIKGLEMFEEMCLRGKKDE